MSRGKAATAAPSDSGPAAGEAGKNENDVQTTRETIESVVVAVVLAFLFRAFVAEAFVIPTGSMAPTLQGRHLDVYCDQCGHRFQTGASSENFPRSHHDFTQVRDATCPICRYTMALERSDPGTFFLWRGNRDAFNGDRILVSKFAYQLAEPKRWDVIVFKYPGNAKQNYIKRLVGLPGETLWIRHGDVFVMEPSEKEKPAAERRRRIARKPPAKVKAMLQLVDDTDHIGEQLRKLGWPSRWKQQSEVPDGQQWVSSQDGSQFHVTAGSEASWLRYRHFAPLPSDWVDMREGRLPDRLNAVRGQLIMDYYPYNDSNATRGSYAGDNTPSQIGTAWVGDLAIESEVVVASDQGQLLLKLVEGGMVFECRFDVATGQASLTIDGGRVPFTADDGTVADVATATTRLQGAGSYLLRFANVDDKLFLWVNERSIQFDVPTTFAREDNVRPVWSPADPLDLAPLGIGGENIELQVNRLKVLRDIYYMALDWEHDRIEYDPYVNIGDLLNVATDPHSWAETPLFDARREVRFELDEDQFFPMGDNSPQSKDARLWSVAGDPPPYVERRYLIGKALLIYWPHAWRPFWPNFSRMKTIQ